QVSVRGERRGRVREAAVRPALRAPRVAGHRPADPVADAAAPRGRGRALTRSCRKIAFVGREVREFHAMMLLGGGKHPPLRPPCRAARTELRLPCCESCFRCPFWSG